MTTSATPPSWICTTSHGTPAMACTSRRSPAPGSRSTDRRRHSLAAAHPDVAGSTAADPRGRRGSPLVSSWDEDELAFGRTALEQLVCPARLGEGKALGDDGMDLAGTKQLEQRVEILSEPLRVARAAADGERRMVRADGNQLPTLAQLLDPVREHLPPRRKQAPKRNARGRCIPFDPSLPALVSVLERRGVAEHDEPSSRPQRTERAQ